MSILDELRDNIPTRFANISSRYFEELICELFVDSGYQVKTRRSTGDLGANMILKKEKERTAVQVRKYRVADLVGVEQVNEAIRGREYHECDKALFITTSAFDESARKLAKETGVELWNWDKLCSEIKKIYFIPKPCIAEPCIPKPCLEAIKETYTLDYQDSSKRIEAWEKAVSLALTKEGRKEIYEDMVNSGRIVDNYKEAVDDRIVGLMTHLARLYEGAYQFSKGEGILQQALELNEGSYVAMKAMSDILLKKGKIDEAIELWKEKIGKGLSADTRWLRDTERKKREGYSFHPQPSTIEELETLIDQGIIPKEQYDYRKKNIIEKQQRRKLEKIRALDTKKKEAEAQALHKYYSIKDVSVLHKDCCDLSCRRMMGKKPEFLEEIGEPGYFPSYEKLTPEQRWVYHEWLRNKAAIIGIDYVFVRLAELIEMLFHENYDKDKVRNEVKFLLELYRGNGSLLSYALESLRLSYFLEQKQFSQEWILDMTQSPVPLVSVAFFCDCGLGYKWGTEVPEELKRYLYELVDKYEEEVVLCNCIFHRLAETYYASGEYENALRAIKSISSIQSPTLGYAAIWMAIEIRYKLNQSLEGHELLIAAGTNNNYYYYASGKKRTKTVVCTEEGDSVEVEDPVKTEIMYHFTDFTGDHFDLIATRCEKKLRAWEKNEGQTLLHYVAGIYDEDSSFASSGNNFMFAKEFIELVAKIAYEGENEIRGEMNYPPIGKPSLTETKLYQLVKTVFKDYEVIRHANPSFLRRQHLDIYIPELKLAIEYQGEQHFKPIDSWGGAEALKASQRRDERKKEVCERHGISIVYFSYKDEVSSELIRNRLKNYI